MSVYEEIQDAIDGHDCTAADQEVTYETVNQIELYPEFMERLSRALGRVTLRDPMYDDYRHVR